MKELLFALAAALLLYIGVLWVSPACALNCWSQVITTSDGRYITCTTCCDFGVCNTTCF